jgi:hypothetical protein
MTSWTTTEPTEIYQTHLSVNPGAPASSRTGTAMMTTRGDGRDQ